LSSNHISLQLTMYMPTSCRCIENVLGSWNFYLRLGCSERETIRSLVWKRGKSPVNGKLDGHEPTRLLLSCLFQRAIRNWEFGAITTQIWSLSIGSLQASNVTKTSKTRLSCLQKKVFLISGAWCLKLLATKSRNQSLVRYELQLPVQDMSRAWKASVKIRDPRIQLLKCANCGNDLHCFVSSQNIKTQKWPLRMPKNISSEASCCCDCLWAEFWNFQNLIFLHPTISVHFTQV